MSKQHEPKDRNILRLTVVTQQHQDSDEKARITAVRDALLGKDIPIEKLIEYPLNIMTLSPQERMALFEGPKLKIMGDGNVVIRDNVPIRALMASSTKVHDLLHVKPQTTEFRVHGKVDYKSINRLLDIFLSPFILDVAKINLVGTHFAQDVLLYQACLTLGIYHVHVKPLLDTLRAEISARLLTVEERNTIVNRIPPTDPLLDHLANDLCHRRFRTEIPNIVGFEKWLGRESRKKLQGMMVEIDQEHKKRRKVRMDGKREVIRGVMRGGLGKVTLPEQPGWNVVRKDV